jgi:hypothetical protein
MSPMTESALELDVPRTGELSGIEIEVPPTCVVHGRVIAPPDVAPAELSVIVQPSGTEYTHKGRALRGVVAADGTFRCPPAPIGELRVSLELPKFRYKHGMWAESTTSGPLYALEHLSVTAATDIERTYDLRAGCARGAELRATVAGDVSTGIVVEVRSLESHAAVGAAEIGEDGTATTSLLPPGEYELLAFAADLSWIYLVPQRLLVQRDRPARMTFDVPLVEGVIEVRDAQGRPLAAKEHLTAMLDGVSDSRGMSIRIDDAGRGRLRAPAARYRVTRSESEESATFDWPADTRVELTAAPR